jgi:8-oxo-dGTP diphosphatase
MTGTAPETPLPTVLVVAVALIDVDGRVLIAQRPEGKQLAGLWEFPGGKVEPGETPEAALIREMREELALEVRCGRALSPVEWDYGRGTMRLMPYLCRIAAGEPQALEHAALRWCSCEEFSALEWAPADVPVWREYLLERGS